MIKYFDGTVFNSETQAIVNTINCVGVMGAGVALEFMLRYPEMYADYELKCKDKKIRTGFVDYFTASDGKMIINFPTKWHFKYPSQLPWIEQGLKDFVQTYKKHGIESVAFPKLGTSNGGLDWEDVKKLIENYLSPLDLDIIICLDKAKDAAGIEKSMLDMFNLMEIFQLSKIVKLSEKQKNNIQNNVPYDRFWKIGETKSIGIRTYSSIFKYFYNLTVKDTAMIVQRSLFD